MYKLAKSVFSCVYFNITFQNDDLVQFQSLQYALFVTCFVEIIGGVFFLITSIYISNDKRKVEEAISGKKLFNLKLRII